MARSPRPGQATSTPTEISTIYYYFFLTLQSCSFVFICLCGCFWKDVVSFLQQSKIKRVCFGIVKMHVN